MKAIKEAYLREARWLNPDDDFPPPHTQIKNKEITLLELFLTGI